MPIPMCNTQSGVFAGLDHVDGLAAPQGKKRFGLRGRACALSELYHSWQPDTPTSSGKKGRSGQRWISLGKDLSNETAALADVMASRARLKDSFYPVTDLLTLIYAILAFRFSPIFMFEAHRL